MKYVLIFTAATLLLSCGVRKGTADESGEAGESTAAETANGERNWPTKEHEWVKLYNETWCNKIFECYPEKLTVDVLEVKDPEDCVNQKIADGEYRRDADGKPLYCPSGTTFQAAYAKRCVTYLEKVECGTLMELPWDSLQVCSLACQDPSVHD